MAAKASDLGELLLRLAIVSRDELNRAVEQAERTGRSLPATLVKLGFLDEETLVRVLAGEYRLPRVDLARVSSEASALAAVPHELCLRLRVVPLRVRGPVLVVAVDDASDSAVLDELRSVTGLELAPVVASVSAIEAALGN